MSAGFQGIDPRPDSIPDGPTGSRSASRGVWRVWRGVTVDSNSCGCVVSSWCSSCCSARLARFALAGADARPLRFQAGPADRGDPRPPGASWASRNRLGETGVVRSRAAFPGHRGAQGQHAAAQGRRVRDPPATPRRSTSWSCSRAAGCASTSSSIPRGATVSELARLLEGERLARARRCREGGLQRAAAAGARHRGARAWRATSSPDTYQFRARDVGGRDADADGAADARQADAGGANEGARAGG